MNTSTLNFSTPEKTSNSTSHPSGPLASLEVSFYIINVIFGLPTHSCIMCLIITSAGITSEFFTLNLSVCEIGLCVSCIFSVLKTRFSGLKAFALTLFGLFFTGRPVFQSLICVERYLAVVHPVIFLKFKPLRYRLVCSAVAWIMCLSFCLCCILLDAYYKVTYMVVFSTMFCLFLSVQLFCCVAVLRVLKQSGPGERGREREEENHMKRRAFYLILITAVSTFIAYVPNAILGFVATVTTEVVEPFWVVGLICFVLCGCVQPVLYLNRAGKLNCFCSTSVYSLSLCFKNVCVFHCFVDLKRSITYTQTNLTNFLRETIYTKRKE